MNGLLKKSRIVLIVLFSLIFTYSIAQIYMIKTEQMKQEELTETTRQVYREEVERQPDYKRFESLLETNNEFVGWIEISGTSINHPVVQAEDNKYYLDRAFNKERNIEGSIFLDYRNSEDFTDRNTIIYGHHTDQGTMFTSLSNYKSTAFYEENPIFHLDSPHGRITYQVFAAYISGEDVYHIQTDFIYEKHFTSFLDAIMERSIYPDKEVPENTDQILTLSTCSYEFNNAKFVVHAREVGREIY